MIQLHELRSAYIYEQIPNFKSSLICFMQPALEGIDCIKWVLDQMSNLYVCSNAIFEGSWAREGLSCCWVLWAQLCAQLRRCTHQMTLANSAHILQSHSFSTILLPYWSYVCCLLGTANNYWMHFIVGTITASLLSLSVWLLGFESLIDGVCNSSVCGDSCCCCCFRLKFHLCICKKRDL